MYIKYRVWSTPRQSSALDHKSKDCILTAWGDSYCRQSTQEDHDDNLYYYTSFTHRLPEDVNVTFKWSMILPDSVTCIKMTRYTVAIDGSYFFLLSICQLASGLDLLINQFWIWKTIWTKSQWPYTKWVRNLMDTIQPFRVAYSNGGQTGQNRSLRLKRNRLIDFIAMLVTSLHGQGTAFHVCLKHPDTPLWQNQKVSFTTKVTTSCGCHRHPDTRLW